MIEDASQVPPGTTLEADVCIVGSGAAGLTLARELRLSKLSVLILESGGLQREEETQKLYRGTARGLIPSAVNFGRLRYFGGTTNHWAGMIRPLDPLDFQQRAWVPNSGWPIEFETLAPYYERSARLFQLEEELRPTRQWFESHEECAPLNNEGIQEKIFQIKALRFGPFFRRMLENAESIRVILHANAEEVIPTHDGKRVDHIQVTTLQGKKFKAKAKNYVIACGGIENARLLLASNSVVPEGLGNQNDLVGRFFMDHLRGPGNQIILWFPKASKVLQLRKQQRLSFGFSEKTMADNEMLNVVVHVRKPAPLRDPTPKATAKQISALHLEAQVLAQLSGMQDVNLSLCHLRAEQAPIPESRVTLGEERDALGMRRVIVDARLGELNRHTLVTALDLFGRALIKSGLGRLHVPPPGQDKSPNWHGTVGKNHQMGTTRMATSPERGVVDPDQRVFGLDNLYIAGSSVFPSAGFMNPTFTIVATTQRLADHLKAKLA